MSKARPVLVLIVGITAATMIVVGAAKGATSDCYASGGQPAVNVISFNADYGLHPYLEGIGTATWRGKERIPVVVQAPMCGTTAELAAAHAAQADQARFYVLLRAFPVSPTRAQWQARFKPLVAAAVTADTQFLILLKLHGAMAYYGPLVTADRAWLLSVWRTPFGVSV